MTGRADGAPAPLVAVPAYHLVDGRVSGWLTGGFAVPEGYVTALRRAGLSPILVPAPAPGGHDDAEQVLAAVDGLLLAGGGDVDPARYGAERHPAAYGVDGERDAIEIDLSVAALERGLPTLAVCRGLQIVNVALGGTLAQHLPERGGPVVHGDPGTGLAAEHPVSVAVGSRLGTAVAEAGAALAEGGHRVERCTSHHHQGVDRLAERLVPVAWADDGLVEAFEAEGDTWMVAVQWHPEASAGRDPVQQSVFDAFATEVRASAGRR